MLQVLGSRGIDFSTLYVLWDDLRSGGWDEMSVEAVTSAPKGTVNRFTGTANNRSASALILPAVGAFLNKRADQINLPSLV